MKHARKAFGLAAIVVISDILSDKVIEWFGFRQPWWPLIISATIAVTILYVFGKYNPIRWITVLRRSFFGEVAIYEGFWASVVSHPARPYSISKIYYSYLNNLWICRGYAFDSEHRIVASWKGSSIHYDPGSKFWFFKGSWRDHKNGSPDPTGPTYDQFFKMKTNPGNTDRMSTIIIDNTELAGDSNPNQQSKTEILISEVRRIDAHDFKGVFNFIPKRIEEITKCNEQGVSRLIAKFFDPAAQQELGLSRTP